MIDNCNDQQSMTINMNKTNDVELQFLQKLIEKMTKAQMYVY